MARDPGSSTAPDPYKYNPWRAPGHAPVDDACGRAGGTTPSHGHAGDAVFTTVRNPAFNVTFGDLGTQALPYAPSGTKWIAGEAVEVGWAIRYNHGGGYQYRLCKKDAPGGLTEACFQQLPLPFDRTKQALLWNNGTRLPLRGLFVDEGTSPAGSTWARNPVPRVNAPSERDAGCLAVNATADVGCVSFAPPCPQDCSGQPRCATPAAHTDEGSQQGQCSGDWTGGQIVDTVIVPASTAPGEYVLGWRWDCEETTQVWSNCADVTICAPGRPCNAPPPFVPPLESS